MNCLASIVKYILYLLNLVFVVIGVLLIVLGGLMLGNLNSFTSVDDAVNTEVIPILVIVLGCIVFLVAFLGCCGAIRENSCVMTTYAICMFVIFALQLALVIWVFARYDEFLNTMSDVVQTAWKNNDSAHGMPMDAIQLSFKCCGLNSYQDYNGSVPSSCCGETIGTCAANIYESRPGCQSAFYDFWSSNMDIIRYAGIGVAIVELVIFTLSCCIASSMRKAK
ncbi:CD63 antigen [Teleopsis dalmanni]|uniref:CD63 antigen n=1 Tax=Teleopsis dalmanni TaxID=139649 RepID=UPI0018CF3C91|nr:CD63 antigen [Teleopsis dalmanni]